MTEIQLFTNEEAAKLLRISTVSLWRRRKERQIGFRRDNGKILYSLNDINEYISRNHQSPIELEKRITED